MLPMDKTMTHAYVFADWLSKENIITNRAV